MTIKLYLIGSVLALIGSWSIWISIIYFLDPIRAGVIGFLLFYLALFLAVASFSNLIGYGIRRLLQPHRLAAYAVGPSLRQGILLGLFCDLLLLLQHMRLYDWWIGIIAIIIFIAIEIIFLSYERTNRRHS